MRYTEIGHEKAQTIEVVREHEGSEIAFCDALCEDFSVFGYDFAIGWGGTCGSEVRKYRCHI